MSSLLYYSISSDLTEDEIIEVDRRVAKDREAVYLFFRELPSNSKRKVKRLFNYGMFLFQLSQAVVPYASSVMFPPPTGVTNNIFANTYESSIYDVEEVASKKENSIPIPINIKTKTI